jgi:hypothetical protein
VLEVTSLDGRYHRAVNASTLGDIDLAPAALESDRSEGGTTALQRVHRPANYRQDGTSATYRSIYRDLRGLERR